MPSSCTSKNKLTQDQVRQFKKSASRVALGMETLANKTFRLGNVGPIRLDECFGRGLLSAVQDINEYCLYGLTNDYMPIIRARARLYKLAAGGDNASQWLKMLDGITEIREFRQRLDQINFDTKRLYSLLPGHSLPSYIASCSISDFPISINIPESPFDIVKSLNIMAESTYRLIGEYQKTECSHALQVGEGAYDGIEMVNCWTEEIEDNPFNAVFFKERLISTGYAYQAGGWNQLLSSRKSAVHHYQYSMALAFTSFACANQIAKFQREQDARSKKVIYVDFRKR